jgi:hypothetical protein
MSPVEFLGNYPHISTWNCGAESQPSTLTKPAHLQKILTILNRCHSWTCCWSKWEIYQSGVHTLDLQESYLLIHHLTLNVEQNIILRLSKQATVRSVNQVKRNSREANLDYANALRVLTRKVWKFSHSTILFAGIFVRPHSWLSSIRMPPSLL